MSSSMRRVLALTAFAAVPLAVAGCSDDDESASASGQGPTVVATTTQVADFARNVAGSRAQVEQILEPNSDPHDYEPRPSDARALTEADVVLRSGGDLDEWLDDLVANAGGDADTVTLIDAVRTREGGGLGHGEEGGEHAEEEAGHAEEDDPHWWHDPANAVAAVERIRDAMVEADPGGRATYTDNAAAYVGRIRDLDRQIAECFSSVAAEQRKLVTNHDALGYFAAHYDIEVIGSVIPALSTQAQASAGEVAELVRTIRAEEVSTIFPESSVDSRLERAIAQESGASVGDPLYADTLGPEGSPGATYLGSVSANAAAMVKGFSGGQQRCDSAPSTGPGDGDPGR